MLAARSLRTRKSSQLVASIAYNFSARQDHGDPPLFWRRVRDTLIEELGSQGLLFSDLPPNQPGLLANTNLAAVIITYPPTAEAAAPPEIPPLCPIVVASNNAAFGDLPRVSGFILPDVKASVVGALDHLRSAGAVRIAMLLEPAPMAPLDLHKSAYTYWCDQNDMAPMLYSSISSRAIADALVAGADAFYLKGNDYTNRVQWVIDEITATGRHIPDDILIVSDSDDIYEADTSIPITTVTWNGYETGRTVASVVIQGLRTGKFPSIVLPNKLIIRESTQR